jgi:hypothetical protein
VDQKFEVDESVINAAKKITNKRPKTVIDHIIKYGYISTEELKDTYGYNHPPRAARDVREEGIPLVTFRITGADGRKIGAYRFGDKSEIEGHKLGGRQTFSKKFKNQLIDLLGEKSTISGEKYDKRYLQIDHRIPYEVAGDNIAPEEDLARFMLLTGTEQRQKSWSCENCKNFIRKKDKNICKVCYWAYPENYSHLAMEESRSVMLTWKGDDVKKYDIIKDKCDQTGEKIQDYIKNIINKIF